MDQGERTGDYGDVVTGLWGLATVAAGDGRPEIAEELYKYTVELALEHRQTPAVTSIGLTLSKTLRGRLQGNDLGRAQALEITVDEYVRDHCGDPTQDDENVARWRIYSAYLAHKRPTHGMSPGLSLSVLLTGVARWHLARLSYEDPRARAAASEPYEQALAYALHVAIKLRKPALVAELVALADFNASYTEGEVLSAGKKALSNRLKVRPAPVLVHSDSAPLARALRAEGYGGLFTTFERYFDVVTQTQRPAWWLLHYDAASNMLFWAVVERRGRNGRRGRMRTSAGGFHGCSRGALAAVDELAAAVPTQGSLSLRQRLRIVNGPMHADARAEHLLLKEAAVHLIPRPLAVRLRARVLATTELLVSLPPRLARMPVEALVLPRRPGPQHPASELGHCPGYRGHEVRRRPDRVAASDRRLCELTRVSSAPSTSVLTRSGQPPHTHAAGVRIAIVDPLGDLPAAQHAWKDAADVWSVLRGREATSSRVRAALEAEGPSALFYSGHLEQTTRAGVEFSALRLADRRVDLADLTSWFSDTTPAPRTVVLSGCSSMGTSLRTSHGEGLGLVGPLVQAGATRILATRWHLLDSPAAAAFERRLRDAAVEGDVVEELRSLQVECARTWRDLALRDVAVPRVNGNSDDLRPIIAFAFTATTIKENPRARAVRSRRRGRRPDPTGAARRP